jgi:hypothetical protein
MDIILAILALLIVLGGMLMLINGVSSIDKK